MYIRNYGLPKTLLDQCLKNLVSEHPSKSNMLNGPKHSSNLKDSPFTIFLYHWEVNSWVNKSLCQGYATSQNCFLTH